MAMEDPGCGFEVVIINNGGKIKQDVDLRRKVNLATACNIGIKQSEGDFIVRVDVDDVVDSQLLVSLYGKADITWCDYIIFNDRKEIYYPQTQLEHACGVMFPKDLWKEAGGFDETLDYQESFDLWQRIGGSRLHIERGLYYYRRGHDQLSANPNRDHTIELLNNKYPDAKRNPVPVL